jgi:hypothetical protein
MVFTTTANGCVATVSPTMPDKIQIHCTFKCNLYGVRITPCKLITHLDNLTSYQKVLTGMAMASVGLFLSILMLAYPQQLRVPLWLALMASSSFVIAGAAVALHAFVTAKTYAWCMVAVRYLQLRPRYCLVCVCWRYVVRLRRMRITIHESHQLVGLINPAQSA